MQKEELARAIADTALNGRCDTIAADVEEVRDIANHKVDATTYTAEQAAQDTKINAAQAAADKANTNIGDWETDHPNQTISQCATSLENETAANAAKADANAAVIGDWNAQHPGKTIAQEVTRLNGAIPDVSGFVTETTYNQGQAAQDSKITAAQTAANKANTSIGDWETEHPGKTIAQEVTRLNGAIPDASGFVTETTYNQGQAAQDSKITAAQTAADKANASIGDWDAQHPGKTIAQEVTRLNGAIPDVSGFVTETTYNQGQAAQDAKITAAQTAANKANTNIGDWDAQHPGKTIAQAVTDAGYLAFLNDLYPQGSVVPGGSFYTFNVFPFYYKGSTTTGTISIPVFVPDIVARFNQCWTPNYTFPTSIVLHDAAGNSIATNTVKNAEIRSASDTPYLCIELSSRFGFPTSGIYYFEFLPDIYFGYSWTKNATPFPSLE